MQHQLKIKDILFILFTQKLVKKAGLPMPKVYLIPDHTPNALQQEETMKMQQWLLLWVYMKC